MIVFFFNLSINSTSRKSNLLMSLRLRAIYYTEKCSIPHNYVTVLSSLRNIGRLQLLKRSNRLFLLVGTFSASWISFAIAADSAENLVGKYIFRKRRIFIFLAQQQFRECGKMLSTYGMWNKNVRVHNCVVLSLDA